MQPTILIIMAMKGEALPLVEALSLDYQGFFEDGYPMELYQRSGKTHNLVLVVNGLDPHYQVDRVGAQPTAVTAYAAIRQFGPQIVLSIGTAGALQQKGARIGDVYLADKITFLDRRIPVAGFTDYGFGYYQSAGNFEIATRNEIKLANLATSNSVGLTPTDWEIFAQQDCVINDMEAASIADLAVMAQIPFYALKGVSNLLDAPSKSDGEDFEDNFSFVVDRITCSAVRFLDSLASVGLKRPGTSSA